MISKVTQGNLEKLDDYASAKYVSKSNLFQKDDLEKLRDNIEKVLLVDDYRSTISRTTNNTDRKSVFSTSSSNTKPWKPV